MEERNEKTNLVIMPENDTNKSVDKLLKDEMTADDSPLMFPLYFECIQSAFISFFKNHERLADERKKMTGNEPDFKSPDNVNNIIAFLGQRGSGKTTAINEFGRILTYFHRNRVHEWWIENLTSFSKMETFRFIVLDSIDASLLTEAEDVVELVLAQMYAKVENKTRDNRSNDEKHNIAEMMDCFRMAYRNYHNLNRGEFIKELGDNVPNILKNIPSGSNVRQAFTSLLECFFKQMELDKGVEPYLVITIDDLDLNIDYGYQLLEKIRKYLSHPRILVLITADFNQLSRLCEVYWLSQYGREDPVRVYFDNRNYYGRSLVSGSKDLRNYRVDYDNSQYYKSAMRLSRDYLLKAIPITHRVYLSGTKDSVQKMRIYMKTDGKCILVKEYIWKKLVEKLGIYYDLTGTKRHFVVPTTVRELVTYNNFLDSLYSIEWEMKSNEQKFVEMEMPKYDWNHYRMNKDITNRMAHALLTLSQKEEFDHLIENNILNRAKYTVNFFKNWISGESKDGTDNERYRYSDLLKGIYRLGREDYHDKELVYCIMAYFTSEMTREHYNSQFLNGEEKKRADEILRCFLGTSFGNKWMGEIVPAVRYNKKGGIARWGFVEQAQLSEWSMQGIISKGSGEWDGELIANKLFRSLEKNKFIKVFGLCMMLFSCFKKGEMPVFIPEVKLEVKNVAKIKQNMAKEKKEIRVEIQQSASNKVKIDLQENELVYDLSLEVDVADFDVLGFIGKEWNEKEINAFVLNIAQGIINEIRHVTGEDLYAEDTGQRYNKIQDIAREQLQEIMKGNEMIFPFYNLDISYNVLKHARSASIEREGIIEVEDIYKTMQRVYGYIAMQLYEEDVRYDQYGITSHSMDKSSHGQDTWSARFINSPFITQFGISYPETMKERKNGDTACKYNFEDNKGDIAPNFNKMLSDLVSSLHIPDIKDAPDDFHD